MFRFSSIPTIVIVALFCVMYLHTVEAADNWTARAEQTLESDLLERLAKEPVKTSWSGLEYYFSTTVGKVHMVVAPIVTAIVLAYAK